MIFCGAFTYSRGEALVLKYFQLYKGFVFQKTFVFILHIKIHFWTSISSYKKCFSYISIEIVNKHAFSLTLLGYSVATGYFLAPQRETIAAGVPNRYDSQDGHFGQVRIQSETSLFKSNIRIHFLINCCQYTKLFSSSIEE